MNIGEVITAWEHDNVWIDEIPNCFLQKKVFFQPNPVNDSEMIIHFLIVENTILVDGRPFPYYKLYEFHTSGQGGDQSEIEGDAKRMQKKLDEFTKIAIAERQTQLKRQIDNGKKLQSSNPFCW